MSITQKRKFGDAGERVAVKYLENKGYKIIGTNFQNNSGRRLGELDVIARDSDRNELVFIEVKTRELKKYENTLPEENITQGKLRKLARIANVYLKNNHLEYCDYRFDAISVWLDIDSNTAKIKHIDHL